MRVVGALVLVAILGTLGFYLVIYRSTSSIRQSLAWKFTSPISGNTFSYVQSGFGDLVCRVEAYDEGHSTEYGEGKMLYRGAAAPGMTFSWSEDGRELDIDFPDSDAADIKYIFQSGTKSAGRSAAATVSRISVQEMYSMPAEKISLK